MTQGPLKIAIVAGESSGDNLGVDLISALKQQYPDAEFKGIAGPRMQSAGCESWYAMDELAVIGVWAILKKLRYFIQMRKELAQKISDWQADLFIGIDAPEFNLDLEGMLKRQGIPTVHYVSPSVWAWRKNRIHKIKANVDLMLTLLPFEEAIYHDHQIPVCCVGHPLAEQFAMEPDPSEAVAMLNVSPLEQTLAVLPGSRMSEILRSSPKFRSISLT
ncbi:MAG: lipid-A-disaccharide synthase [Gammaproteobacteria bacterium]